jgi:hypothetical protein
MPMSEFVRIKCGKIFLRVKLKPKLFLNTYSIYSILSDTVHYRAKHADCLYGPLWCTDKGSTFIYIDLDIYGISI